MTTRLKAAIWEPLAPERLSLQPAALKYCVSVDTLRRRVAAGELPASRLGRRLIRVRIADLDRMFPPHPERAMVTTSLAVGGGPLILAAT